MYPSVAFSAAKTLISMLLLLGAGRGVFAPCCGVRSLQASGDAPFGNASVRHRLAANTRAMINFMMSVPYRGYIGILP